MLRLIAITHREWLQWIADGAIRCSFRIRQLSDRESLESLRSLLMIAPAFSLRDDGAIVFAQLSDGGANDQSEIESTLALELVQEFFPLNERGAQLIEGDARRANVRLSSPYFSGAFDAWRESELKRAAHNAGLRFVRSAGFAPTDIGQSLALQPVDGDRWKPKEFAKFERRRGTRSFGCRVALSILEERIDTETWKQVRALWGSPGFPKEADAIHVGGTSACDWQWFREKAQNLREHLRNTEGLFPLVQQTALAYWRDRLESQDGAGLERQNELDALARDLRIIEADEGVELAVEATYLLGRIAMRDTVNQLHYAANHTDFPSLCVTERKCWLGDRVLSIQALCEINNKVAVQDSTPAGSGSAELPDSASPLPQADGKLTDFDHPTEAVVDSASRQELSPAVVPCGAVDPSTAQAHGKSSEGDATRATTPVPEPTTKAVGQVDPARFEQPGLAGIKAPEASESTIAGDLRSKVDQTVGSQHAASNPQSGSIQPDAAKS